MPGDLKPRSASATAWRVAVGSRRYSQTWQKAAVEGFRNLGAPFGLMRPLKPLSTAWRACGTRPRAVRVLRRFILHVDHGPLHHHRTWRWASSKNMALKRRIEGPSRGFLLVFWLIYRFKMRVGLHFMRLQPVSVSEEVV